MFHNAIFHGTNFIDKYIKYTDKPKNDLKVERAKNNITQAQLAEKVHVSRQAINAIKLGKYNLSTVLALKIAHVFGKPVNDIFELEESDWKK
ncbi:MAG: helix-turn-helix transcriptional regulator [Bacteroidales bacterium]|nr:helix-turn-helix transcriptional regulator [Bacteroidales bacterium]